jgi:hypothetical protein
MASLRATATRARFGPRCKANSQVEFINALPTRQSD